MRKAIFTVAVSVCALGVAAQAQSDSDATPQQLVAARQGGMAMLVANLGALSRAAEADGDDAMRRSTLSAKGMAAFARGMPALFAEETRGVAGTKALPEVWQDKDDFAARIAAFQDATAAVEAAAKAGDRAGFSEGLARTKAACQSCHTTYRAEG